MSEIEYWGYFTTFAQLNLGDLNGKEKSLIYFFGNYTLSPRDRNVEKIQISSTGNSGKGKGNPDFYATVWMCERT
jgi:hypothetical protein